MTLAARLVNATAGVVPDLSSRQLDTLQREFQRVLHAEIDHSNRADRLLHRAHPWIGVEWREDSSDDECRRLLSDIVSHLFDAAMKKETR